MMITIFLILSIFTALNFACDDPLCNHGKPAPAPAAVAAPVACTGATCPDVQSVLLDHTSNSRPWLDAVKCSHGRCHELPKAEAKSVVNFSCLTGRCEVKQEQPCLGDHCRKAAEQFYGCTGPKCELNGNANHQTNPILHFQTHIWNHQLANQGRTFSIVAPPNTHVVHNVGHHYHVPNAPPEKETHIEACTEANCADHKN